MKHFFSHTIRGSLFLAGIAGFSLSALAEPPKPADPAVVLDSQVRLQGVDENNASLGTGGSDNAGVLAAEAKFRVTANINEDDLFFWEGRGVTGVGQGGFETSDTGAIFTKNNFLEWRQSYLQFSNLGGQPYSIRAGRQRVRDSYGDWWNQDFDAVRLAYDSTLFKGFVLAGQDLFSYNTAQSFTDDDREIARVLAEGSWQYHYQQFLETRLMLQDDYSGIDNVGTVTPVNDGNTTDGRLTWAGVRAAGKTPSFIAGADKVQYRVDVMGVAGHENSDITAPSGASDVIVTATNDRDVMGWAVDAGVDIPLAFDCKPDLHLGYAYGSGDDNPNGGTDHAFRQNGLAGNFSRLGDLSQNESNYGTVLRPQLSNIHILSAGFTMPVFSASDLGLIYRYYRLAEAAASLPASGVNNALDNHDRDLGHAVDLLYNMDIYKEQNTHASGIKAVYLRSSLGAFRAGSAYGANEGETAARGLVEVGFDF